MAECCGKGRRRALLNYCIHQVVQIFGQIGQKPHLVTLVKDFCTYPVFLQLFELREDGIFFWFR